MMFKGTAFEKIPIEILVNIFSFLCPQEVLKLRQTSTVLKNFIDAKYINDENFLKMCLEQVLKYSNEILYENILCPNKDVNEPFYLDEVDDEGMPELRRGRNGRSFFPVQVAGMKINSHKLTEDDYHLFWKANIEKELEELPTFKEKFQNIVITKKRIRENAKNPEELPNKKRRKGSYPDEIAAAYLYSNFKR